MRGLYTCSNQLPQRLPIDVPNTTQVDKQELAPCPFMLGNQLGRPAFTVADHSKDLSEASTTESLTDTPYALEMELSTLRHDIDTTLGARRCR